MTEVGELLIRIEADTKKLRTGLSSAKNNIKSFETQSKKSFLNFKKISETALGFGFASLVTRAISSIKDFAVDSIKAAIQVEQSLYSLELQTNGTANALITDLRKASKSMVSDLNLISSANRALALGISKNQLPKLMEVATARAKIMGITATQAFNDISIGIGRQSRLILDNLGIILDLDKAYTDYAVSIGKTVDQLSESEKKTALTNSILKESAGLTAAMAYAQDDMKSSLERLSASWEQLKLAMGDAVLSSIEYMDVMIELSTGVTPELIDQIDKSEEALTKIGHTIFAESKTLQKYQDDIKGIVSSMTDLSNVTISGQAEFELEEQKLISSTDRQNLRLAKDEYGQINLSAKDRLDIERLIQNNEEKLKVLRLERKVNAENMVALAEKENKVLLEKYLPEEQSILNIQKQFKENLKNIVVLEEQIDGANSYLETLNQQAITNNELLRIDKERAQVQKMMNTKEFGGLRGLGVSALTLGQVSPAQGESIIKTIMVKIDNIYGTDPEEMSQAFANELDNLIKSR